MVCLFFLTEFSILQFLSLLLRRKTIYLLPSTPVISPMSTLIEKLKNLALKFGWAKPITLVCPNFTPEWEHPKTMLHNIFGSLEDWQNKYYRFDIVDNFIPGYGQAYRHVVCNYVSKRLYAILAISDFQDTNGKNSFYVSGFHSCLQKI